MSEGGPRRSLLANRGSKANPADQGLVSSLGADMKARLTALLTIAGALGRPAEASCMLLEAGGRLDVPIRLFPERVEK
jgi:hypothetical protein